MPAPWTSRQRLRAALRCQVPDRLPVSTYELVGFNSHAWENREPSYRRLMDRIRADTDCIAMWGPASNEHLAASAHVPPIDTTSQRTGTRTRTHQILHTPKGNLQRILECDDRVHTTWVIEHWCKTLSDVDALLSIPYQPVTYDFSDLPRIQGEVADHGIIMESLGDPALAAADLMSFQDFLSWAFEETAHFERTVNVFAERMLENLRRRLTAGVVDLYRICGPEYFTPPYLPPALFQRFVVPHVRAMTRLIHDHGGQVRLHCHGKIGRVLDMIFATEPDAIDPCEPPPDGDIELDDLKRRCAAARVSVFGNVELRVLETASPQQVRATVQHAIRQAKAGGGFVLMPTAAPINVPLSPTTESNYLTLIDTALQLGPY